MKAEVLHPASCILGESPVWDEKRGSFFWVDIERFSIYEYNWNLDTVSHYQLDRRVSLVVPGNKDELILGLQGGIGKYYLNTRELVLLTDLGLNWESQRCNDGASDVNGRLWVGAMALDAAPGMGTLYMVDKTMKGVKRMEGLTISNGMAWTRDNTAFYHTDSVTKEICIYQYEEQTQAIRYERTAITIDQRDVLPDGIAMDEEGMLWVALWGGFGVGRYDTRSGKMISFIDVPAPNVTSCAFAGEYLDMLVITTARKELPGAVLQEYPLSGHVFMMYPGIKGQARYRCGL